MIPVREALRTIDPDCCFWFVQGLQHYRVLSMMTNYHAVRPIRP